MAKSNFVFIGIALVVVALALPRATRYLRGLLTSKKGKISLDLTTDLVHTGERLNGSVDMDLNQAVRGGLKVSLLGMESKRGGSGSGKSRMVEVYRLDHILEETREFPENFSRNYDFKLTVPTADEARPEDAILEELGKAADLQENSAMATILKFANAKNKIFRRRTYWSIEARLEVDGLDLVEKQRIKVVPRK